VTDKAKLDEINGIIKRSGKGKPDSGDLATIKKFFAEMPDFWKHAGDMSEQALTRLYENIAPNNLMVIASIKEGVKVLRKDLGYDTAPRLEQLLIDEICYSWVSHSLIKNRYAGIVHDSVTLTMAEFWERRMTQSQKRYLRSLDTLARVRKLLAPIQINIADKQVNQVISKT